jgi:hypothetical protein
MRHGAKVRITIQAGLMLSPLDTRFVATAEPGTEGFYLGPHRNRKLALDGWHLVAVRTPEHENPPLVAPLHMSQFEETRTEG